MRTFKPFALLGLGTAALTALVFACGFDPPEKNPNPPTGVGGACAAAPGAFPTADCDGSENTCTGGICTTGTGCCKVEAKCGDTTTCMPLADNAGKPAADFRMRRLTVVAPPTLATTFVQNVVINQGVDLAANGKGGTPACGESGDEGFNWLIRVNKTAGTMTTGGAPPPANSFIGGYCFFNSTVGGLPVQPETVKITYNGDSFDSDPIPKLNVPIFVNGLLSAGVVLPLRSAVLKNVTVSDNNNCIGKFQAAALDKTCNEDVSQCLKWKTAGSLGGFITIEESDQVYVSPLAESLCVLLTGSPKDANGKCQRGSDGTIALKGDYCSTTQSAGGCQDSFWLAATFAASAALVTDGADVPECHGSSSVVDAGADTGSDASDSGQAVDGQAVDAASDGAVDAGTD